MSNITNNTSTPQNSNLIDFVKRAVNNHFSDVLNISSLKEYDSKYLIINFNSSDKFLKINYEDSDYHQMGSVLSGYAQNIFKNYGELKKAIRNGILQVSQKNMVENNSNIHNNYKISKNYTPTPQNNNLIDFVKRAVNNHFSDVLDILSLNEKEEYGIKYLIINFNDSINFLKIVYEDNDNHQMGSVLSGYAQNMFKNYGELKKAIRNGILQVLQKNMVENNSNIHNNYKMTRI